MLDLRIDVAEDGTAGLVLRGSGSGHDAGPAPGLPLVDLVVAGAGRSWSGSRYSESVAGRRLRYRDHEEQASAGWRELQVGLEDPVTGLRATVSYQVLTGHGVLRSWV